MRPTFAIILLTTMSGAGFGLLAWLGLLTALGSLLQDRSFGLVAILTALGLVSAGFITSISHLARPERALLALSQWRSSWLSREGIAALLCYLPALAFLLIWFIDGYPSLGARVFGALSAALSAGAVVCTAMIYVSLPPIRQWSNNFTLPNYLSLALYSGAVALTAITTWWDAARLPAALAALAGVAALAMKLAYWRHIDTRQRVLTPADATGLGRFGEVRQLEPPHVEENYLLREMGFRIARRHAARLRGVALLLAFAAPMPLQLALPIIPMPAAGVVSMFAFLFVLLGLIVERWLFFAEATHTVVLYYGRSA